MSTTGISVSITPNDAGALDLQTPDSALASVIWPLPRSMKIDMAAVLNATLQHFGLNSFVTVVTTGAFQPSMMRDADNNERAVIVLQRAGDEAQREALGELTEIFTFTDIQSGRVLDPGAVLANLPNGEHVIMKDQVSSELVDVWLFDENDERCEQLYLFVKTALFACTKTFTETLGYRNFIRVNGQDAQPTLEQISGGVYVVFQKNLMYRGEHIDFIAGIDRLANVIQEQFTSTAGPRSETLPPVNI